MAISDSLLSAYIRKFKLEALPLFHAYTNDDVITNKEIPGKQIIQTDQQFLESEYIFAQPLDVNVVNEYDDEKKKILSWDMDCLLNTGMFAGNMAQELQTRNFVNSGLLFLAGLDFSLEKEMFNFKASNGIVNMNMGAGLYIGGLYHLLKTRTFGQPGRVDALYAGRYDHGSLLPERNWPNYVSTIDGSPASKYVFATEAIDNTFNGKDRTLYRRVPLQVSTNPLLTSNGAIDKTAMDQYVDRFGYGAGNTLYDQWTNFIRGEYLDGTADSMDSASESALHKGCYSGVIKPFKTGYNRWNANMDRHEHYATYSNLSNKLDFSGLYNPNDKTNMNVLLLLAAVKSLVNKNDEAGAKGIMVKVMTEASNASSQYIQSKSAVQPQVAESTSQLRNTPRNVTNSAAPVAPVATLYSDVIQYLMNYATLPNGGEPLTYNNEGPDRFQEVADNVIEAIKWENAREPQKFSDQDYLVALYPSAGGLYDLGEVFNRKVKGTYMSTYQFFSDENGDHELNTNVSQLVNLYHRSMRFIWCQSMLPIKILELDPQVNQDWTHKTPTQIKADKMASSNYSVFGKLTSWNISTSDYDKVESTSTVDVITDKIQNVMHLVGLHNMEALEDLFVRWVDERYKYDFTDTFHFTTVLKSIMMLERGDFTKVAANDKVYSPDEQMGMLYGFSFVGNSQFTGSDNGVLLPLLNLFLTNAQHNKLASVTSVFMEQTVAVNNHTTVGLLTSGSLSLMLEQSIFRREIMWATDKYNTYDYGFLMRKILFGDQAIDPYPFQDLKSSYSRAADQFGDLIMKYYDFRPFVNYEGKFLSVNKVQTALEFMYHINVKPTEDVVRLLMPFIGSYIAFRYFEKDSPTPDSNLLSESKVILDHNAAFNAFFEKRIVPIYFDASDTTKSFRKTYFESFMNAYKAQLSQYVGKDGDKTLTSSNGVQEDTLTTYKTATYYNLRAMYENNVYVPETAQYSQSSGAVSHNSDELFNEPMFYNFTQEGEACGMNLLWDGVGTKGKRPRHLYEYVQILDRGNNSVGHDIIANLAWVKEFLGVKSTDKTFVSEAMDVMTSSTYWSFFSAFSSQHNCLMHPLSSYMNLAGTQTDGESLFGTFSNLEKMEGAPAFIIQYIGDMESVLSNDFNNNIKFGPNRNDKGKQSSFCFDVDFKNGQPLVQSETIPQDIQNGAVSCFVVDFGNQNQQVFKNIQIDTSQFTNTEESIKAYVDLTLSADKRSPASGDLFKILSQRSYTCQVDALGNAMIQPLSYFYLKNVPLFTGAYRIVNVSHRLEANVMTTSFKGVRQPMARIPNRNELMLQIIEQNAKVLNPSGTTKPAATNTPTTPTSNNKFLDFQMDEATAAYKGSKVGGATQKSIITAMDYFQNKAVNKQTFIKAACIVGHLIQESDLIPTAEGKKAKSGNAPRGIAQWFPNRFNSFLKKLGVTSLEEVKLSAEELLVKELEFVDQELSNDYAYVKRRLDKSVTIADALMSFAAYEAFNGYDSHDKMLQSLVDPSSSEWGHRVKYAKAIISSQYPNLDDQANDATVAPNSNPYSENQPSDINNFALDAKKSLANVNGNLDTSKLTKLDTSQVNVSSSCSNPYLYPKAASQLIELAAYIKQNARDEQGKPLAFTISAAYRPLADQQSLKSNGSTAGRAARPGHSSHGYGIAVDIQELFTAQENGNSSPDAARAVRTSNALYKFLEKNAARFKFYNPYALRDGQGTQDESWHWEYHEK